MWLEYSHLMLLAWAKGRSFEPLGHPFRDLLSQCHVFCKLVYEIDAKFSQNRGLQTPTPKFSSSLAKTSRIRSGAKGARNLAVHFQEVSESKSWELRSDQDRSKHHGNLCKWNDVCQLWHDMYSDIPKIFYQVGSKQGWGPILWLCSCHTPIFGDVDLNASGKSTFLVATDVAARGLDIPKVGAWKPRDDSLALVPVEFQTPCWTNRSFFLPMPTHWNLIVFSPSWQISSVLGSFLLLESFPCLVVVFRRHDSFNMIDHTSLAMMLSEGPFMLESYYVQTELSFWYGGIPSVAGVSCHQLWFAAQHRLLCSPNWSPTELMPGLRQLWTWSKCRIAF